MKNDPTDYDMAVFLHKVIGVPGPPPFDEVDDWQGYIRGVLEALGVCHA